MNLLKKKRNLIITLCFAAMLLCSAMLFCAADLPDAKNTVYAEGYFTPNLEYTAIADGYAVAGVAVDSAWNSASKDNIKIVIPATYNGSPVTEITNNAFESGVNTTQTELKSAKITSLDLSGASNLRKIGDSAFSGCESLVGALNIPNSVTTIGDRAFILCKGITSLKLPKNADFNIIDEFAFANCEALAGELIIPDSVTTIKQYAFGFCQSLEGALNIPDSVTTIGKGAFNSCMKITSLKLPENNEFKTIEDFAFYYCVNIKGALIIPDSVTTIGGNAFNFSLYDTAYLPANATTFGSYCLQATKILVAKNKAQYDSCKTKEIDFTKNGFTFFTYETPITFDANGGKIDGASTATQTKLFGGAISAQMNKTTKVWTLNSSDYAFPPATKPGYIFSSYNTQQNGAGTTLDLTTLAPAEPTTYYAQFTENPITSIAVTNMPNKTIYTAFENFDKVGMKLTATFNDGSTSEVTDYTVVGGTNLQAGTSSLTISYFFGGVTKTTTVAITVNKIELTTPTVLGIYTYNGSEQTVTLNGFDTAKMSVTGNKGTNADNYQAVISLTDKTNYAWTGGSADNITLAWKINKATPQVIPSYNTDTKIYVGGTLPKISSDKDRLGTIEWNEHTLSDVAANKSFGWTWTPTEDTNYNVVKGSIIFDVLAVELESISVSFDQGETKVFTSNTLDSLKNMLTVTGLNNDGTAYSETIDYTLSGTLTAENSTITVTATETGMTATFNVTVTAVALESISATFDQGETKVFTSSTIDSLKNMLTVTGLNNDGTAYTSAIDYELSGTLTAGTSTIAATFNGKTTTFDVKVTAVELESIKVTAQPTDTVYTAFQNFDKTGMVITAEFNDGVTQIASDYTVVNGNNLQAGTNSLTISYTVGGVTKATTVSITVNKIQLEKPSVVGAYTYKGSAQIITLDGFNSGTMSVTGNTGTDANDYQAVVSLNDKTNYSWTGGSVDDVTLDFMIAKAILTVTANNSSIFYGEAPAANGVTYEGFVNGEGENVLTGILDYAYNYSQGGAVGDYTITPRGLNSNNYKINFVSGTLTVKELLDTVYLGGLSGNDANGGTSATDAVSNVNTAIKMVASGGTIVVCGDTAAPTSKTLVENKSITFTNTDGVNSYADAVLRTYFPTFLSNVTISNVLWQDVYTSKQCEVGQDVTLILDTVTVSEDMIRYIAARSTGAHLIICNSDFSGRVSYLCNFDSVTLDHSVATALYSTSFPSDAGNFTLKNRSKLSVSMDISKLTSKGEGNIVEARKLVDKKLAPVTLGEVSIEQGKPIILTNWFEENLKNDVPFLQSDDSSFTMDKFAISSAHNEKFALYIQNNTIYAMARTVSEIVITPSESELQRNQTQQFTASVSGSFAPSQEVIWSVSGGKLGTSISADGLLTVASDEAFKDLIITAVSVLDGTKSVSVTVTVVKRNLSEAEIGEVEGSFIYNGTEQKPTVNISDNSNIAESDYEFSYRDNIIAGTATITITATENGNYTGTVTRTFTINKAKQAINTDGINLIYTYTGAIQTVSGGATVGDSEQTVSYQDNMFTTVAEGNGKVVTISVAETQNYLANSATVTLIVQKATYDMSEVSFANSSFEYDGQSHSLTLSGTLPTGADGISPTVSYAGSATTVADGTVNVTATFATTSANYNNPAAMIATLAITAKEVTLSWAEIDNLIYNKQAKVTSAVVTNLENGDICTVTVELSGNKDNINVGKFKYTATELSNDNYRLPSDADSNEFEIKQKLVELRWAPMDNLVYDKQAKIATASVANLEEGDECAVIAKLTMREDNVNVGEFTFIATELSNKNYKLPNTARSGKYFITPKAVELDWAQIDNLEYNKQTKETSASLTNLEAGDICNVRVALTNGDDNINVGKFTYTAIALDNKNYILSENIVSVEYVITPKEVELSWGAIDNLVFNNQGKLAIANITNLEENDICYVNVKATQGRDNVNVGIFTCDASGLSNPNYKLPSAITSGEYTITPLEIVIKWVADDFTYNGENQQEKVSANYIDAESKTIILSVKGDELRNYNRKGVEFTAKFANNESNYILPADTSKIYHIKKCAVTVKADDARVIYGENASKLTAWSYADSSNKFAVSDNISFDITTNVGFNSGVLGSYYTRISPIENSNYDISYIDGVMSVEKRVLTVTIDNATSAYGNAFSPLHGSITSGNVVNDDSNLYALSIWAAANANVGEYAIVGVELNSNYAIRFINGKYAVTARELTNTMVGSVSEKFVYNKNAHTPIVTVNDGNLLNTENDISFSYRANVNAGEGVVIVNGAGNYKGSVTRTFTISKADYDISGVRFESSNFVENGSSINLYIMVNGRLPDGVSVEYENNGKILPGNYKVTAIFSGDKNNYNEIPSKTAILTINAKKVEINKGQIIVDAPGTGIAPEAVIRVDEIKNDTQIDYRKQETVLSSYNFDYKLNGITAAPDNNMTIRILIDENYRDGYTLKVYSISDGSKRELNAARDGDYLVISAEKLSDFSITAEKDLTGLIIGLSIGGGFLFLLLLLLLLLLLKKKKENQNNSVTSEIQ